MFSTFVEVIPLTMLLKTSEINVLYMRRGDSKVQIGTNQVLVCSLYF